MVKKTALKIECGSFSHGFFHLHVVDLQLLLQFSTAIFGIFGCVIYRWNGIFKTFPTVYLKSKNYKNFSRKSQKKLQVHYVCMHKTMAKRTALDFECNFFTMFCYSGKSKSSSFVDRILALGSMTPRCRCDTELEAFEVLKASLHAACHTLWVSTCALFG